MEITTNAHSLNGPLVARAYHNGSTYIQGHRSTITMNLAGYKLISQEIVVTTTQVHDSVFSTRNGGPNEFIHNGGVVGVLGLIYNIQELLDGEAMGGGKQVIDKSEVLSGPLYSAFLGGAAVVKYFEVALPRPGEIRKLVLGKRFKSSPMVDVDLDLVFPLTGPAIYVERFCFNDTSCSSDDSFCDSRDTYTLDSLSPVIHTANGEAQYLASTFKPAGTKTYVVDSKTNETWWEAECNALMT